MPRAPKQRQPRTRVPDKPGVDGSYHCYVPTGEKRPNGKPEYRHVRDVDRDECVRKVLELEDLIDAGKTPPVGTGTMKVEDWLTTWLTEFAPRRGGYKTLDNRRWAVNTHLIPRLGQHLLVKLDTATIENLYFALYDEGLSPKSIELLHEALSIALGKAVAKKYIAANPATEAERPEYEPEDIDPPSADEITAILNAIIRRPDRARWLTQFLGPRQGETLGLLVDDFELDEQIINVRGKLQRRSYEHGCDNPADCARPHCRTKSCDTSWSHGCGDAHACAKRHCKTKVYPSQARRGARKCPPDCEGHAKKCPQARPGCRRHTRPCPPLCDPGCTRHASHCPKRIGGLVIAEPEASTRRAVEHKEVARPRRVGARRQTRRSGDRLKPKTAAGRRRFGIPDPFVPIYIEHFAELAQRQAAAGLEWVGIGLAFCGPLGQPIDPRADWGTWCDVLEEADVDHMPVHWIRHITASLLLAAGVDGRIVMDVMGWSDPRMLQRYQHVADELRRDAANRLAGVLSIGFGRGDSTARSTASVSDVFDAVIEVPPESKNSLLSGGDRMG